MKIKIKQKQKLYLKITELLHYYTLLIIEFLLFSTMPLFVKIVFPIKIFITIYLIIFLIVNILENMRIRFTFFCSKPQQIHFGIFFVVLCYLTIILRVMRSMLQKPLVERLIVIQVINLKVNIKQELQKNLIRSL